MMTRILKVIAIAAVMSFQLTACISTTTGTAAPVANNADAADINYQLGARYYTAGSYDLARDRLELAVDLNPRLAVAYSTLALTYEALDNIRLATDAYEAGVRAAPNDYDMQNAYAVFLCRRDDPVKARRHFDKAIGHAENDNAEVTMTNAGICMNNAGDKEAAETYFRAALDRKPAFAEALLQICLLKYSQKDYLSSRAFLQRYMSSNIPSAGILYLAARIEDLLGNDSGRTDFENQLLREFPTSAEARKVLGSG